MEKKRFRFDGDTKIPTIVERFFLVFLSDGQVIQLSGGFPNKKQTQELIGNGCTSIVNIMELNKEDWEEWGR